MNNKFSEDFLLTNEIGKSLYNKYAAGLPVINFNSGLNAKVFDENKVFEDLGELWLSCDPYKWHVMRTFGIEEKYITGDATYYEKFMAFAKIMPELIGSALYIWSALELKRCFGIEEPLCEENAVRIYQQTKTIIHEKKITPQYCLKLSSAEISSTPEDPASSLKLYKNVLASFCADRIFSLKKEDFDDYIPKLAKSSSINIYSFETLLIAFEKRLMDFKDSGTILSESNIQNFVWTDYKEREIADTFRRLLNGKETLTKDIEKYQSAFRFETGKIYWRNGFVMQLRIIDNGESSQLKSIGKLLIRLSEAGKLPKTIIYPEVSKIEEYAALAARLCEKEGSAKVQIGLSWDLNGSLCGIKKQFESIASVYPLSLWAGFISGGSGFFSGFHHEIFRRLFCNYLGKLCSRGVYFSSEETLKKIIQNVCYYNAKNFIS